MAELEREPWLAARLVAELAPSPLPGNVRQLQQLARRLWIDWGDAARVELPSLLPHAAAREQSEWRPSRAARLLGVCRATMYALIQRTPSLATAWALGAKELQDQLVACGGDLDRTAQALRVSRRGLLLRLRELELAGEQRAP